MNLSVRYSENMSKKGGGNRSKGESGSRWRKGEAP
jgi:hypothetical protein